MNSGEQRRESFMDLSIQTLVFPLINRYSRQFFELECNDIFVRFLYDSGAKMPVWCRGTGKFMIAFPEAEKLDMNCRISGFGKGREKAEAYMIPSFCLDDGSKKFVIERLVVALLDKPYIGCDFLISETMFSKVDTFTYRREKRELHIVGEDRPYYCTARQQGTEVIDITVWAQEGSRG